MQSDGSASLTVRCVGETLLMSLLDLSASKNAELAALLSIVADINNDVPASYTDALGIRSTQNTETMDYSYAMGLRWHKILLAKVPLSRLRELVQNMRGITRTAEDLRLHLVNYGTRTSSSWKEMSFMRQSYTVQCAERVGQIIDTLEIIEVTDLWKLVDQLVKGINCQLTQDSKLSEFEKHLENTTLPTLSSCTVNSHLRTSTDLEPPDVDKIARSSKSMQLALQHIARQLQRQGHPTTAMQTLYHAFLRQRRDLLNRFDELAVTESQKRVFDGFSYSMTSELDASSRLLALVNEELTHPLTRSENLIALMQELHFDMSVQSSNVPEALRIETVQNFSTQNLDAQPLAEMMSFACVQPIALGERAAELARIWWHRGGGTVTKPYTEFSLAKLLTTSNLMTNSYYVGDIVANIALFTAFNQSIWEAGNILHRYYEKVQTLSVGIPAVINRANELIFILATVLAHNPVEARSQLASFTENNHPVHNMLIREQIAIRYIQALLLRYEGRAYEAFVAAKKSTEHFGTTFPNAKLEFDTLGIRCLLDSGKQKHQAYASAMIEPTIEGAKKALRWDLVLELGLLRARVLWHTDKDTKIANELKSLKTLRLAMGSYKLSSEYSRLINDGSAPGALEMGMFTEFDFEIAQVCSSYVLRPHSNACNPLNTLVRQNLAPKNLVTLKSPIESAKIIAAYHEVAQAPAQAAPRPFTVLMRPPAPCLRNSTLHKPNANSTFAIGTPAASILVGEDIKKRSRPISGSPQRPESKRRGVDFADII